MKRFYSKYSIKRSGANRTDVTRGVTAFKGSARTPLTFSWKILSQFAAFSSAS